MYELFVARRRAMNYNGITCRYSRWSLYDNLTPPQFIEVPVPSTESERHVCVVRVSNCPLFLRL